MRAMILCAGLGTRLRALSQLCAKPALPVMGLPLLAYLLRLLQRHGVEEVLLNLHHLPETIEDAVARYSPPGIAVRYTREREPLGTGGGIRCAADFLRESDPSWVLAGDMLLDADLSEIVRRHRARADRVTLLLRRDVRAARFGSIGIDREACVRRIGSRLDLLDATDEGLFLSSRLFSARAFESLPEQESFEDLSHWLGPQINAGARDIRGEILDESACVWEPVGTPMEYLTANLQPPVLSYVQPQEVASLTGTRREGDVVLGAGARLVAGAQLRRSVVWEGEVVPGTVRASDGVFAAGKFHRCGRDESGVESTPGPADA